MRLTIFLALLTTILGHGVSVRGDDELFSQVAMESVFEKNTESATREIAAKPAESKKIERITGVSGLVQILKGAELEPTSAGNRVTVKLESAGWVFPISFAVDVQRERILCDLSLVEIQTEATIDRQTMLQLMAAGDPSQSAFFAFDPTEKVIQLRTSLSNRNVTAAGFARDLQQLARFAESKSKIWAGLGKQPVSEQEAKSGTIAKSSEAGQKADFSLDGRWSASVASGEAFAVQFDASGRFALIHLKAGKSTKSVGKAIRDGESLVLEGDTGTKLKGSLTWADAKSFQLAILDAAGKATVKLSFKKQS